MRVSIIGAGVAGMTCAVEFAERGIATEVFEQADSFGPQSCSWFAGGMLAPWCECDHSADLVATLGEAEHRVVEEADANVGATGELVSRPRPPRIRAGRSQSTHDPV